MLPRCFYALYETPFFTLNLKSLAGCFKMSEAGMCTVTNLATQETIDTVKVPESVNSQSNTVTPGKRETEENTESPDAKKPKWEEIVDKATSVSNRVRKPRKAVLLLSYLGKIYSGMQRNEGVNTVEEELFKALLKADIILKEDSEFPKNMRFQRAARTDKGVSAVRQIVSLKIPLIEISDSIAEKVNIHLPPDIRLVGAKRVTQAFDAKIACDARTYSYMCPTFAFESNISGNIENYRISDEKIQEVNKFLSKYLGTKNFYNFTSGRLATDPSCNRFIMSCECEPPFESHGLEFSVIKIKGQSFMLHQIRKMVGLMIACMRNLADGSVLEKAWLKERLDIPKAPGLGLMLESLHYDWYNTKYGNDGMHEKLEWSQYDPVVNKFKLDHICANIAITEREEKSMLQWLETLPYHTYDVRENGPPPTIPAKKTGNSLTTTVTSEQTSEPAELNNSNIKLDDCQR